jgi:Flp pilus assembly pilin Flp
MGNQIAYDLRWQVRATCRDLGILVRRFLTDETGQDLIEYALLTATIGLASAAAWVGIGPTMGAAYNSWDLNVYNLWESPNPVGP